MYEVYNWNNQCVPIQILRIIQLYKPCFNGDLKKNTNNNELALSMHNTVYFSLKGECEAQRSGTYSVNTSASK